jgi:hypothetical protein
MTSNPEEEITNLIGLFGEACQYLGYKPEETRKICKEKGMKRQEIIKLLIATIFSGNNISRLSTKVSDPAKASEIMALVSKYGIVRRAVTPKDLTLPRIASAFAPILLKVRTVLNDDDLLPKPNVSTTTPAILCDVSLACASHIFPAIKDYLVAFGRVIKDRKMSDEDSDSRAKQFAYIASSGAQSDPFMAMQNFESVKTFGQLFAASGM